MIAHGGCKKPVDGEDDKRHQHEDGTQLDHQRQRIYLSGADELRQERHEENRQLGIEDVDQYGTSDHLHARVGVDIAVDTERTVFAQRTPSHVKQIGDTQIP